MEMQVQLAAEHYGFTYVILRAGPLFGPGSQTTSSISEFTQLILQVRPPSCCRLLCHSAAVHCRSLLHPSADIPPLPLHPSAACQGQAATAPPTAPC